MKTNKAKGSTKNQNEGSVNFATKMPADTDFAEMK